MSEYELMETQERDIEVITNEVLLPWFAENRATVQTKRQKRRDAGKEHIA